ncbi:MAG: PfkB family carbohydrate kinase [Solirubrobacteraceae bacterium]
MITKYPRADYVCIDREEALLASRDRFAALEDVILRLSEAVQAQTFAVTRGPEGAIVKAGGRSVVVPAFSKEVVDTAGAGDAFFALTSPLARMGVDAEVIGFVGNAVGTLAVGIVGNRESVEPAPLYKVITTLLK